VAGYVGLPPMNLLIVGAAKGALRLRGKPDLSLPDTLAREIVGRRAGDVEDDILVGIRPEKVRLGVESGLRALVLGSEEVEGRRLVHLDLNGQHLSALTALGDRPASGTRINVELPADACHVFLPPSAPTRAPAPPPVRTPVLAAVA
jgi:ABC-type sugar transport system ATPase subunit